MPVSPRLSHEIQMFYVTIFVCETDMFCCRLQSQVDVDSGVETMSETDMFCCRL